MGYFSDLQVRMLEAKPFHFDDCSCDECRYERMMRYQGTATVIDNIDPRAVHIERINYVCEIRVDDGYGRGWSRWFGADQELLEMYEPLNGKNNIDGIPIKVEFRELTNPLYLNND